MMRKKVRCDFCGTILTNEKCHTVRGKTVVGLAAAFSSSEEPTLYDAVDCPKCGKQKIVGIREREYPVGGIDVSNLPSGYTAQPEDEEEQSADNISEW